MASNNFCWPFSPTSGNNKWRWYRLRWSAFSVRGVVHGREAQRERGHRDDLGARPDDVALLHLSIGSPANDVFRALPCRKAILYHNVSPPRFFELVQPQTARLLAAGIEQVTEEITSVTEEFFTRLGALEKVNAGQQKASALTEQYERGETIDIAKVMLARQEASVGFEATLQVRNKLLSAYKDIMSMPV